MRSVILFILIMWGLVMAGGGIAVTVLGPITISGYGQYSEILTSALKAAIAIAMVLLWVVILTKIKNLIFKSQMSG